MGRKPMWRHNPRRERPRGRGSNYQREKWCPRCGRMTTHLYDHGINAHVCQSCERQYEGGRA